LVLRAPRERVSRARAPPLSAAHDPLSRSVRSVSGHATIRDATATLGRRGTASGEGARFSSGTRVFALAPQEIQHCCTRIRAGRCPLQTRSPRAVLAANLETALTCVWDATSPSEPTSWCWAALSWGPTAWLLSAIGRACRDAHRAKAESVAAARSARTASMIESERRARLKAGRPCRGRPAIPQCSTRRSPGPARGSDRVRRSMGRAARSIDLGDPSIVRRRYLRASQVFPSPPRLRERWTPSSAKWLYVPRSPFASSDWTRSSPPRCRSRRPRLVLHARLDSDVPPAHSFV